MSLQSCWEAKTSKRKLESCIQTSDKHLEIESKCCIAVGLRATSKCRNPTETGGQRERQQAYEDIKHRFTNIAPGWVEVQSACRFFVVSFLYLSCYRGTKRPIDLIIQRYPQHDFPYD